MTRALALAILALCACEVPAAAQPHEPCPLYDADCGQLFRGRVACMQRNDAYHWSGPQVYSYLGDGRQIVLPVAQCVFVKVPREVSR